MDSAVLTPRPCQEEATFYPLTLLPFMSDLASDQRYGSTSVCCPRCHPGSSAHSSQCWKCPIPDENAMCQTWTTRSTFRGLYAPLRREAYFPVPKVHSAFVHNGSTYILMDRIDGKMLTCGWSSRSAGSKTKILTQLKRMVDELRSLPPPSQRISDVNGGPLYDDRFPRSSFAGPFNTIHDFHFYLRDGVQAPPDRIPAIVRMISLQDRPWPMPVFTHGDLSGLNILVRGDDVVGIINRESAGWYPSDWEYSMAWNGHPWNVLWKEEVNKFLDATPEEVKIETTRHR